MKERKKERKEERNKERKKERKKERNFIVVSSGSVGLPMTPIYLRFLSGLLCERLRPYEVV